MKNRYGTLSL